MYFYSLYNPQYWLRFGSPIPEIVSLFEQRVASDGGEFEAESCLANQLDAINGIDLLDTASLCLTPNGYKEGKLYSVIPSDGSGDMSVTRATTATRVNSAGLVELVPYNLFSYSQNLADASWSTYAASGTITRTANYGVAPDGTTTATRIQNSGGDPIQWTYQNIALPSNGIISMYVKRTGVSNQTFRFFSNNGATFSSNFTATDTWQRFEFAVGSNTGALPFGITTDSSGTAADILVWGAQIVEGSVAKDYQKTETRLNIPRLDYSNGTCPSLLVEPQRTNLVPYSQDITNAVWTPQTGGGTASVTRTANYGIAPDGTMTADRLQLNKGNTGYAELYQYPITTTIGTTYTFSAYVKSLSGNVSFLFGFNGSAREIENATTEWTRITWTNVATGLGAAAISLVDSYDPNTSASVDLLVWGFQVEQGSYPTSYIPTTTASVTRNADVVSKTGISSLIGQTEGTIFLDFVLKNPLSATNRIISITESVWNTGGSIRLDIDFNQIKADFVNGGSNIGTITYSTTPLQNTRYKVAIAYKENDCQMYVNGVDAGNDTTTAAMPTCSELYLNALGGGFNAPYEASNINASALWKTRLSNTQLATLTSL